jgi:hypothetical protein
VALGRWPRAGGSVGGAEMTAYDVNGDGLNDIVTSLGAHTAGPDPRRQRKILPQQHQIRPLRHQQLRPARRKKRKNTKTSAPSPGAPSPPPTPVEEVTAAEFVCNAWCLCRCHGRKKLSEHRSPLPDGAQSSASRCSAIRTQSHPSKPALQELPGPCACDSGRKSIYCCAIGDPRAFQKAA